MSTQRAATSDDGGARRGTRCSAPLARAQIFFRVTDANLTCTDNHTRCHTSPQYVTYVRERQKCHILIKKHTRTQYSYCVRIRVLYSVHVSLGV